MSNPVMVANKDNSYHFGSHTSSDATKWNHRLHPGVALTAQNTNVIVLHGADEHFHKPYATIYIDFDLCLGSKAGLPGFYV
jgi:hypothetical protein